MVINDYGTADDGEYTFNIKIMSPLYEGVVKAVGGKVEVPATSASGYEVNDSHVKGYTYNDQVYSIFCDVADEYDWTRKELKDVSLLVKLRVKKLVKLIARVTLRPVML